MARVEARRGSWALLLLPTKLSCGSWAWKLWPAWKLGVEASCPTHKTERQAARKSTHSPKPMYWALLRTAANVTSATTMGPRAHTKGTLTHINVRSLIARVSVIRGGGPGISGVGALGCWLLVTVIDRLGASGCCRLWEASGTSSDANCCNPGKLMSNRNGNWKFAPGWEGAAFPTGAD